MTDAERDMSTAPLCVLVLGMASSGKTLFVSKVFSACQTHGLPVFTINLDPAVLTLPYEVNADIRDSVDYRLLMQRCNLGPNGATVAALNLYAARINELCELIDKQCRAGGDAASKRPIVLIDSPGQIEAFTWSTAGNIISQALSSMFPTVVAYMMDVPLCKSNPKSFVSNMLYACSILYKMELPMVAVLNKTDSVPHTDIECWLKGEDRLENLEKALMENPYASQVRYADSFALSLACTLVDFYDNLSFCGFSSSKDVTENFGFDELIAALNTQRDVFIEEYWPIRQLAQKSRKQLPSNMTIGHASFYSKAAASNGATAAAPDDDDDDDDGPPIDGFREKLDLKR